MIPDRYFQLVTAIILILLIICLALLADIGRAASKSPVPHHVRSGFLCIHRYEGAWNDPNAPYYGGLQMDVRFMKQYGGWIYKHHGTADHWKPATQILVAYRGWKHRGWHPWPNTARTCGLL